MVLDQWVDHEYWLQMMNILSLLSLGENVDLWASISLSNLWELSLDVIGEASEFFDVHRFSCSHILSDVFDQGFPDEHVLGLWLKRLKVARGSSSRCVVLSWVFWTMGQDPNIIMSSKEKLTSR